MLHSYHVRAEERTAPSAKYATSVCLHFGVCVAGYDERQDGHTIAGALLKVRPGERKRFTVSYHLPLNEGRYSLELIPQPLARDARVDVMLEVPAAWVLRGDGDVEPGRLEFSGELDRTLEFSAERRDRTGISGLWDGLVRFWREPLF